MFYIAACTTVSLEVSVTAPGCSSQCSLGSLLSIPGLGFPRVQLMQPLCNGKHGLKDFKQDLMTSLPAMRVLWLSHPFMICFSGL